MEAFNASIKNQFTKNVVSYRIVSETMLGKFRGTLYGVLAGDCCGAPFEGEEILNSGSRLVLRNYFDKLEGPYFSAPKKSYTDDTALTLAVARNLTTHKTIDQPELAADFVRTYYENTHRGYGRAAVEVFQQLRKTNLKSPLQPARDLFNGIGSFGNGGAMRIAPVALFCHGKSTADVVTLAKASAEVTHTHRLGINGTILQALAIHQALQQTDTAFDCQLFLNELRVKMQSVEDDGEEREYGQKLDEIERLLRIDPSDEQVVNRLGNSYSALKSVPTAIYCFLRTISGQNMTDSQKSKPFRHAIEYAITLGGDTDTIAAMTGALCGALFGENSISKELLAHCEGYDDLLELSTKLYEASLSN